MRTASAHKSKINLMDQTRLETSPQLPGPQAPRVSPHTSFHGIEPGHQASHGAAVSGAVASGGGIAKLGLTKIVIIALVASAVVGGTCVGIVAGTTDTFDSSSSSSSDDDDEGPEVGATTCPQCWEPSCPSNPNVSAEWVDPSVSIADGSGTTRFTLTTNNYPCHEMDGEDIYVVCPTPHSETMTSPVPILCTAGQNYNGSTCTTFTATSQPHFGDVGFLGRPPSKSKHWSSSNVPIEAVSYDPLPAECGDVTAHECNSSYGGEKRFSILDVQRLNDDGDTVTYDNGDIVNVEIDDYNSHVQPQGSTNPESATGGNLHYHGYPGWDDGDYADYVIGYAKDGIPIMGRGTEMVDGNEGTSSYKLKSGQTGAYHMDYEYTAGEGTLDQYNGGLVTIDGVETYAYFSTEKYPYLFRNFRGQYGSTTTSTDTTPSTPTTPADDTTTTDTDSTNDSSSTSTDSSSTSTDSGTTSNDNTSTDTDSTTPTTPTPNPSPVCSQCYTPECPANSNVAAACSNPSVTIVDGSGSTRFTMTANNYPCHTMQGTSIYVVCPSVFEESITFPTASLCPTGYYHDGTNCRLFNWSSVQPAFGDVGFLGRSANKNMHWSSTNKPMEGVSYDPLPAECADRNAHECDSSYSGTKRFSVVDVQRLEEADTNIQYDNLTDLNVGLDPQNAHVQPGGSQNPSEATHGAYHYHGYPEWDNGDYADYIIGYAKDGVPIMGRNSKLANGQTASSSYALRDGQDGRYHMDYEYKGTGTLDEFNGGLVTIDGTSTYAYFSTSTYPYLFRNFHGDYNGAGTNLPSTCDKCYTPQCPGNSNVAATCSNPSVSIAMDTGSDNFTLTANNYPCHDMVGPTVYVVCPSEHSESMTFPNPNLCSAGQYHDGTGCKAFTWSSVQPHFGDVGFLGRPYTKSAHWSDSHKPIEGVSYDPLPAECADEAAHGCNGNYTGEKRFSVVDVQRLEDGGTNVKYDNLDDLNISLDSFNSHVQPGPGTDPSSATYGAYHYHGTPGWDDGTYADYVIGYAKDGVPIMGLNSKLADGSTASSSYELRNGKDGRYHMDYEYTGNGTLDAFNGGLFTIGGSSIYAYCSTSTYPYLFRNFHGDYAGVGTGTTLPSTCSQCYTPTCPGNSNVAATCSNPSVSITMETGSDNFTLTANNYPCHEMDGGNTYVVCPSVHSESMTFPNPNLCSAGQYHDGTSCQTFTWSSVQPHFGDVGFVGRPYTKSTHWSDSHKPIEGVSYDPLPAECSDEAAHGCNGSYTGQKRFSVVDVQRLEDSGTNVTYDNTNNLNIGLDSQNSHVQPGPGTDPSSATYGAYHYHGTPGWDDGTYADYVIGYAKDGVPIMGLNSKLADGKTASSSYELRNGKDGRYHMDYEYTGNGNLDEFNGGQATIGGSSTYAYFSTSTYPYLFRNFHGDYAGVGTGTTLPSTCSQCYTPTCPGNSNVAATCSNPSVDITMEGGSNQFTLTANNYPCHEMDGGNAYVVWPSVHSESMTFPDQNLCSAGQYHDGTGCKAFTWNTVQPHFGDVGFLGRSYTKSTHWSNTHKPIEGVSYDPLPAECSDEAAHGCNGSYTGQKRFSVVDVQRLEDTGTDVTYDNTDNLNISLDSQNSHVQPGPGTDPSSATYGAYHYHGTPGWDNGDYADYVIGYAKDGVPIMGLNSKLKNGNTASSSYVLRNGKDGRYHMDYEYDGSGTLDEFNGGTVTLDSGDSYAYFSTSTYPYLFRNFHGDYAGVGTNSPSATCSQCYTPSCSASQNITPTCNTPSVSIVDESGPNRFTLTANNVPCHDMNGSGIYVICPTPVSESMTFPNPVLCSAGEYYNGDRCQAFTWSSVQPHFGDVGYLGRQSNKNAHWSASNTPSEGVSYDPLPAECYDETAHQCQGSYTGQYRFSVEDVQRLEDDNITVTFDNGQSLNVLVDDQNAHVQPQGGSPQSATAGAYHYHANPGWDNGDYADYVIGYAKDGVPIMGRGSQLSNGDIASSSYTLRSGQDGRYHMDYEYDGSGTLDEFNGGLVTIDGVETYAYFSTAGYPYLFRNFHGQYS